MQTYLADVAKSVVKKRAAKKAPGSATKRVVRKRREPVPEQTEFLKALRTHQQVIDADSADVELPPGVNYVLVRSADEDSEPELVERRKSFI